MERFALGEKRQPPVAPFLSINIAAADEIAFADHPDHYSRTIDNGYRADFMLEKPVCDLGRRGIRRTVTTSFVMISCACMSAPTLEPWNTVLPRFVYHRLVA